MNVRTIMPWIMNPDYGHAFARNIVTPCLPYGIYVQALNPTNGTDDSTCSKKYIHGNDQSLNELKQLTLLQV